MTRTAAAVAILAGGFWGTMSLAAAESPAGPKRIFEDYGTVTVAEQANDGAIWIKLWEPHIRFRVAREPRDKLNKLGFLIGQANESGRAIRLRYDGTQGQINSKTGTLDYPVCAILLDDLQFEPSDPCSNRAKPARTGTGAALTLAHAQMSDGEFEHAQKLLAGTKLPSDPATSKLLLKVRAQAQEGIAATAVRLSADADRATAGSLVDYRALARLEPDDVEHQFAIAAALLDLGGYAEAQATYDQILQKWPEEEYRVAIRIGALHRAQGNYEKALQPLDNLVARRGAQEGMRFHYHRGWTLTLLGRFDNAVRELTEGMKSQPDYSSAYLRRACAYASLGQLKDALADVDRAASILASLPGAMTSKLLVDEVRQAADARRRIEAELKTGEGSPLADLCSGPSWDQYERPRLRSPLLPGA